LLLDVRVIPRAKRNEIAGTRDGVLLLRVAAPPVEGAANDAVVELLSSALHVPPKNIRIVGGERSRRKRVAIDGVTADQVRALATPGADPARRGPR
jgi:uncharacterized protein (TIGR00251 family)